MRRRVMRRTHIKEWVKQTRDVAAEQQRGDPGFVGLKRQRKDVAQQALPAHHQHIRLWRSLPDVENELGAVVKAEHDPREPIYWEGMLKRDEARLTHRVKTLYGFYTLRRFIEDAATTTRAEDAFLYLMA